MPLVNKFINDLKQYSSPEVYNPWSDFDGVYDIGQNAPDIRCVHLEKHLRLRLNKARVIFVAEALGFQGGHFSGIAMTSERMLLDNHPKVSSSAIIGCVGQRTSNPRHDSLKKICKEEGHNEPTATIVWASILENCKSPFEVVLWNIFPFHPYKGQDTMTNRTPSAEEQLLGIEHFQNLHNIFYNTEVVAIGAKSDVTLAQYKIKHYSVRHPANGGANDFRTQIEALLKGG